LGRMGLRDRLEGGATRLGTTAREVAASGSIQRATSDSLQRGREGFRGLRAMFSDNDEQSTTFERFLILLVRAVRDDERTEERSARDVFETARSRRRRLGLVSFGAGPLVGVANQVADLYCETATFCDLAQVHGLALNDHQIVAHMLVLWSITDTLDEAKAAIDGSRGRSVAGILSSRVAGRADACLPDKLTKRSATKALWNARGAVADAGKGAGPGAVGNVVFAGHRMKRLIKKAELQLGVR